MRPSSFIGLFALLGSLLGAVGAGAQTCNCNKGGAWVPGGADNGSSTSAYYHASVTGGPLSYQLTVTSTPGGAIVFQRSYAVSPLFAFFRQSWLRVFFASSDLSTEYCDLYDLDKPGPPDLLSYSGAHIDPCRLSNSGTFLYYGVNAAGTDLGHILRTSDLQEYVAYGVADPSNSGTAARPAWGPDDRSFFYLSANLSGVFDELNVYNVVSRSLTYSGEFTQQRSIQYSPCGDLLGITGWTDSTHTQVEVQLLDVTAGGTVALSSAFPPNIAPALVTTTTEHDGDYSDGSGPHTVFLANNTATQSCPPPTVHPLALAADPSSVTSGDPVTFTLSLSGPAPFGGLIYSLSASDWHVSGFGNFTLPWGSTGGSVSATTSGVMGTPDVVTMSVDGTSPPVTTTVTVVPRPAQLASITLESDPVNAGDDCVVDVHLTDIAPPGGAQVAFSSTDPTDFPLPATFTIPAGSDSGSFTVHTPAGLADHSLDVNSSYVVAVPPQPQQVLGCKVGSLATGTPCASEGAPLAGTIGLTAVAPPGGFDVVVTSSDPTAMPSPGTFHVAAGQRGTSASFATLVPASETVVTLTASGNATSAQCQVTIEPHQAWAMTRIARLGGAVVLGDEGHAINDAGQVVGVSDAPGGVTLGYRWTGGASLALPGYASDTTATGSAWGISPAGFVTGDWKGDAFLWNGTNTLRLTTAGGSGQAVNDLGHVAGWLIDTDGFPKAFFRDSVVHVLGTLGGTSSWAYGLNAEDVVVGGSLDASGLVQPFRWTRAGGRQQLPIPPDVQSGVAYAVNHAGVIVGDAIYASGGGSPGFAARGDGAPARLRALPASAPAPFFGYPYACLWDAGGPQYLDTSIWTGEAIAINDARQVVGWSHGHAVLWDGTTRTELDGLAIGCGPGTLDALGCVGNTASCWIANGINNHGQIAGTMYGGTMEHAWVLTPATGPLVTGVGDAPGSDVPRALALAVMGTNPVRGSLALRCSLERLGPARLELLDVSGRRLATRELADGAAVQFIALPEAAELAPGVYFARLSQAGHARQLRVALLR